MIFEEGKICDKIFFINKGEIDVYVTKLIPTEKEDILKIFPINLNKE